MASADTRDEILRHLDEATRKLSPSSTNTFNTSAIASRCNVSRNLASQYLNELVRAGLVVKVNARPVLYLHRRGLERYLQSELDHTEFPSMQDLLSSVGMVERKDFEKAIGFDLSLSTCVEQLRGAVGYPPFGLPALLIGGHGSGKDMLARLAFEYGTNSGALPQGASLVKVNCTAYEESATSFEADVFGQDDTNGAAQRCTGGIVYLSRVDHLPLATLETLTHRILEDSEGRSGRGSHPARFILGTARPPESPVVQNLARMIPIAVELPDYAKRTERERTALVMHCLHAEGRRVAADVSVSRGALRALASYDFDENIDGLRACVTNCCASAFLSRKDEGVVVRSYNLPSHILGSSTPLPDDDQLVSSTDREPSDPSGRLVSFLQRIVDSFEEQQQGEVSLGEFMRVASGALGSFQDAQNFESQYASPRVASFERVLAPVIEGINADYGIELSRKVTRSLAQSLSIQLWDGTYLSMWRAKNRAALERIFQTFSNYSASAGIIARQIATKAHIALGIEFDCLTQALLSIEVVGAMGSSPSVRDTLGVIICHGYSTATSIADAANRILGQRVYEAIDMPYSQELSDVMGQLTRLVERFAFCKTLAVLVDMGSLAQVDETIPKLANGQMYVADNVSTGLALEVGSALINHGSVADALETCVEACKPTYRAIASPHGGDAIAFCSEAGSDAADKIRRLVQDSLPQDLPISLITCDFLELAQRGDQAGMFSSHNVRLIVGTMDPGVTAAPFVPLGDIVATGASEELDKSLSRALTAEEMDEFHVKLLRNLTLRNVAVSITILNPEILYLEADRAMHELARLSGESIEVRKQIGLYVHLCGLIERLVTKSFVDDYPDMEAFERDHADFVRWFRAAFDDMCRRYRVTIPVSEVGYVYHMLHEPDGCAASTAILGSMEDE
ncbi:sigma 54-interacting transcriptional regulator [Parafannyhessea umbonata]|uniref:Transcriptional regulatory protein LevR, contains PRD, AAA+ and EIIA domains n=1 Tax=Parafannyhessea umbonata TaxID=604330 RepID=A0A1H9P7C3_9ACTN|nr:sigma 54-interacting transcriptional regulator [Parafannyhessea umbonata]SER44136.1 Transcriptional regulatory protein LevR, contains PRD, AAA+ and EIIA domains [Parafannyhessea umbonata]